MKTLFCILLLVSDICISYSQELQKIRIDPAQAYGGGVSDYFDHIEYIPLETTKESLFGDVTEMLITNDSYVIYDWDTKSILFFKKEDGKFLTRKTYPQDASINIAYMQHSNNILVSISLSNQFESSLYCFSSLGEPDQSFALSNKIFENGAKLLSIEQDYFLVSGNSYLAPGRKPSSDSTFLLNVYKNNTFQKGLLPVTQTANTAISMIHSYLNIGNITPQDSMYLAMPLNHIVYKITKDTAVAKFQLIFPASRIIDPNIISENDIKKISVLREQLYNDQQTILSVSNIFFHKNTLFFKVNPRVYTSYAGSNSEGQYNFIYDIKNGSLASLERMHSDSSTNYLPIFGQQLRVNGLYSYNDNIYTSVSSLQMFAADQANKNNHPKYPKNLESYFSTQTRKSNPVIVRMRLKE